MFVVLNNNCTFGLPKQLIYIVNPIDYFNTTTIKRSFSNSLYYVFGCFGDSRRTTPPLSILNYFLMPKQENNFDMQNNSTHILTSAQTTQGEIYKERFFKTVTDFYQFHEPSTLIDTNSELLMCFFKIAEAEEPLPHFVQNTVWNATQQNIFLVKLHETLRDYLTSIKSEIKI